MRCRECNVDLSENYTKCPLCGSKAYDDEPKVKNIKAAPYPVGAEVRETEKTKKPGTTFTFEKIKAFFNV